MPTKKSPRADEVAHDRLGYAAATEEDACPDCGKPLTPCFGGLNACFCLWGGKEPTAEQIVRTAALRDIQIVRVGVDPHNRTNDDGTPIKTVYYRDLSVSPTETFYCWLAHWSKDYPQPHTT